MVVFARVVCSFGDMLLRTNIYSQDIISLHKNHHVLEGCCATCHAPYMSRWYVARLSRDAFFFC
jgi:hypothetical protein